MKRRTFLPLALAVAFFCAAPAWSADYQLKKNGLKVGDTVNEVSGMSGGADLVLTIQGQEIKGKLTMDKRKQQVSRITAVDGSGVTGVESEVKEDRQKQSMTINGKDQNSEKNEPLHETSLIARKADGKWSSELKSGTPTDEQAKALAKLKYFESDEFFEDKPVAVGQSWAVPPERLAKAFSDSLAGKVSGAMQCKFERVEDLDGRPCAVIAVEIKVTGNLPDQPEANLTMEMKGTIHRALELNYDAQVTLDGTMKLDGPIPKAPPGSRMEANGPMTMTETMTLVK